MDFSDFATVMVAMFSLIVSILAFGHQWLNSIHTWKISDKANETASQANATAERALAVTLHDHKVKITPVLVGYCYNVITMIDAPEDDFIMIVIKNKTHAKVDITSINCIGFYEFKKEQSYPITLLLNGEHVLFLQFRKLLRGNLLTRSRKIKTRNADEFVDYEELFRKEVQNNVLHETRFEIDYSDELGTNYYSVLEFSKETNLFTGDPIELAKNAT